MLIRTRVRESGQEIVINTAQVICVVDSGGFAAVTLPMLHMSNGGVALPRSLWTRVTPSSAQESVWCESKHPLRRVSARVSSVR